jgi:hypothetical protein
MSVASASVPDDPVVSLTRALVKSLRELELISTRQFNPEDDGPFADMIDVHSVRWFRDPQTSDITFRLQSGRRPPDFYDIIWTINRVGNLVTVTSRVSLSDLNLSANLLLDAPKQDAVTGLLDKDKVDIIASLCALQPLDSPNTWNMIDVNTASQ